ncbi:NACHT domain-containing protein [Sideroxyarcus sp. TK5]
MLDMASHGLISDKSVTKQNHNWPRFWVPLGALLPLDDSGFLNDPDEEHSYYYYSEYQPKRLQQLTELPVAILLGEPGIGKSTTLKVESDRLKAEGEACLYRELNQYHSDMRLINDVFESAEWLAWRQGHHHLTLLLDSLDECRLTIPAVARILAAQLESVPTDRLSLRLTCRTFDWPEHLTRSLKKLWPSKEGDADRVSIFELAPLRRVDIQKAAADRSLNGDIFLEEVLSKEIQPLASHPITLNMLLGLFGRPNGLPKQRAELYRQGCETLSEEHSSFRNEAGHAGTLNKRQRMAVAGRIAAQMIFSQRSSIWLSNEWEAEAGDLIESEMIGDVERADGHDFPLDSRTLKETVECTALFSGRGHNRTGFAHQSYAEFLAAWHLYSRGLDALHTLPLLLHPDDKRIPPQHAEAAIWLAALDGEVFNALAEKEPLLLLRTDLSDKTDVQKALLAENLLQAYAMGAEFDQDWGLRKHYRKLKHPGLAGQLRPYISGKEVNLVARRAAMEMAASCEVHELTEELLSIALDPDEQSHLREEATYAVTELANDKQLGRLRPIALGETGDDPEDRLKSVAIPALWPAHVSTGDIFGLFIKNRSERCLGIFRYKPEEFVAKFTNNDMSVALQWIADDQWNYEAFYANRLKDAVMKQAWGNLDDPHVLDVFTNTAWICIDRYENLFNRRGEREESWLEQDDSTRRIAIMALLNAKAHANNEHDLSNLMYGERQIILPKDAGWLLETYKQNESRDLRGKLAKCIGTFVRWDSDTSWLEAVISAACKDACQTESPLADTIEKFMEPIGLDSDDARIFREQLLRQNNWRSKTPLPLDPPAPVRVEEALLEFESGRNDSWMKLWQELFLPDDAINYSWSFDNVSKSRGWQRATSRDRSRILACAKSWLDERKTSEDLISHDRSVNYLHAATYLALRLLFDESTSTLLSATSDSWNRWAAFLVAYPLDQDRERREKLMQLAYIKAPEVVLKTFRKLIDTEITASQPPHRARELACIWTEPVASMIGEYLLVPDLKPEQISTLLEILLEHGDETAYKFACGLVKATNNQPLALTAAQILLAYQTQRCWKLIWETMSGNTSFGKELMLGLSNYSHRNGSILTRLTEAEIAELYFWLEEHFPAVSDTPYPSGEAHTVTARDQVGRMRDNCPSYLSRLGTPESIKALDLICSRFPKMDWLKYQLNEAMRALRKQTLQAITPSELISYTHRRDARLARSSAELMDAVLISLRRLQERLHGQTPMAPFLWNLTGNGDVGRPKTEDRISDFIQDHLQRDLPTFVIDREVQVRNLKEHGIGERTDLKIETKDQDGRSISVIIENKGCWNKELMTAMQSQLYDRYLKLAGEACGIYLVGWFMCDRWDSKSDCVFKNTKEALLVELTEQANSISSDKERLTAFVLDATY